MTYSIQPFIQVFKHKNVYTFKTAEPFFTGNFYVSHLQSEMIHCPSFYKFTCTLCCPYSHGCKQLCPQLKRYSLQEGKGRVAPDLICKVHSTPPSLLGPRSFRWIFPGVHLSFLHRIPTLSFTSLWNQTLEWWSYLLFSVLPTHSPLEETKRGSESKKKRGFWWKRELLKSPPLSLPVNMIFLLPLDMYPSSATEYTVAKSRLGCHAK